MGGVLTIVSAKAIDIFKGKNFGLIYGLTTVGFAIGGAVGPWLAGYIFEADGSYIRALVLINVAFLISAFLFWCTGGKETKESRT